MFKVSNVYQSTYFDESEYIIPNEEHQDTPNIHYLINNINDKISSQNKFSEIKGSVTHSQIMKK